MKTTPDVIYLQCRDDEGELIDYGFGEVTWCADQINTNDEAYVRAKEFERLLDVAEQALSGVDFEKRSVLAFAPLSVLRGAVMLYRQGEWNNGRMSEAERRELMETIANEITVE